MTCAELDRAPGYTQSSLAAILAWLQAVSPLLAYTADSSVCAANQAVLETLASLVQGAVRLLDAADIGNRSADRSASPVALHAEERHEEDGCAETIALSLIEVGQLVHAFAAACPFSEHSSPVAGAAARLAARHAGQAGCAQLDSDASWRYLAWACAVAGEPSRDVFGMPSVIALAEASAAVWSALAGDSAPGHVLTSTATVPLRWLPDWISEDEANVLLAAADAGNLWNPSPLSTLLPGQLPHRTSQTALLVGGDATLPVLDAVRARAAAVVGLTASHVEALQLVRYGAGERYLPHFDWGSSEDVSLWLVGQRVATVLVYLNDVPTGYEGGCTRFTHLGSSLDGLRVAPRRRAAIVWPNVSAVGFPLFETEHEAEPLTRQSGAELLPGCDGRKVAMNIWIRDRAIAVDV